MKVLKFLGILGVIVFLILLAYLVLTARIEY